jgi:eukaryotic-like serine/threonine-protein kinase
VADLAKASHVDPLSGERFGKYSLIKRLAVGGMAEVYLAKMEGVAGFSKLVVIKLVLPSLANEGRFIDMFLDEARLAARLNHPNIAQTFDLGSVDGRYYIALEYVPGESLWALTHRAREVNRRFPTSCSIRIVMQVLEALQYAHTLTDDAGRALRIVHRDVSPSNIAVTFHGGVKLLDFGIARAASQSHHTQVGFVKGKFGYMAPEQCRAGLIDGRTDIFAAGAVLYRLVTGRSAFEGGFNNTGAVDALVNARFPPPRAIDPGVAPELEATILRAMTRDPNDRYPDAAAMLRALEQFAAASGVYPGAGELADFVTDLFPDHAAAYRNVESGKDVASMVDAILSVSDSDIVGGEPEEVQRSTSVVVPVSWPDAKAATAPDGNQHPAPDGTPSSFRDTASASVPSAGPVDSWTVRTARKRRWTAAGVAVLVICGIAWALGRRPEVSKPVVVEPPPTSSEDVISATPAQVMEKSSEQPEEPRNPEIKAPLPEAKPTADDDRPASTARPPRRAAVRQETSRVPKHRSPAVAQASPQRADPGKLRVITTFHGDINWMTVMLDGVDRGASPLSLEVPSGKHQLKIERPGFRTVDRSITVAPGETEVVRIEVQP